MPQLADTKPQEAVKPDYLGREALPGFEGKPSLPVGGPALGVSTGPATVSGSGVVPEKAAPAPEVDDVLSGLMRDAERFVKESAGGGPAGGVGEPGGTSVSGFDPGAISLGINAMSSAAGIPGLAGLAQGLMGAIPTTTGIPNAGLAGMGAKGLMGLLTALGLLPEPNVTMNTPQGPVQGVAVNTPTGLLGLLSTLFGIGPSPGIAVPDIPNPTGIPSEHSPDYTVAPPGISEAVGYTDPSSVVGVSPGPGSSIGIGNAPTTGPGGETGPGTGVSAGGGGSDTGAGAVSGQSE